MSTYMAADSATSDSVSGGYECSQCNKVFRRDAALRRHREVSHTDTTHASDDNTTRRYRCQTCRRAFTSRPALSSHRCVVHDSVLDCDSSVRQLDTHGELVLVEDCCVDDEICIAADGGSATFQTDVTTDQSDSGPRPTTLPCNNNNTQLKNKNVIMQPTVAVGAVTAVRSASSSVLRVSEPTPAATTSTVQLSAVNLVQTSRKSPNSTTVAGPAVVSAGRLVSVSRSSVETPQSVVTRLAAPQRTTLSHSAIHKTPTSPLEAETFHGDAHAPTSSAPKIIVYVKSEPASHQQHVAYCPAESTTSGVTGRSGTSAPCQFVCPVCGRDFASEKYLSMHVSSIHRTNNDIASIIALETAASPTSVAGQTTVLTGESSSVDTVAVALSTTPSGTIATAAQPSSTSVGGSKSHWTCNICRKAFAQNSSYKNHIRTHSDDRPYVCSICSIGFKERYHLKKHELFKHTTALNETCRICGKRFKDSTAVRAHERIHSDVRPYGCTLCGKTFKTSECLWHHENRSKTCGKMGSRNKQVGVAGVVTLPAGQRQRRATISHVVNTAALTSSRLSRHSTSVASPHADTDDTKPELSDLQLETDHDDQDSTPPPVVESTSQVTEEGEVIVKTEPADCELFDASLNTMLESSDTSFVDFWQTFDELDVVTPSGMDSGSPDHICSSPDTTDADSTRSADEGSTTPGTMYNSISSLFDGVKRHDCARCDKRFASAATLAKHLQVHAEVRPYRCTVCDIGFKLKVHLKKHNLYRHSEEYPCECSICGKRFKDSSAVRLHERIHSTARPFQCLHCGKSFKTRENLWGHRNRGPCEQRSMTSLLLTSSTTSYPVSTSNMAAPQFVASNVRLFHSAEFGPILGVPVNAKLVLKEGDKLTRADERSDVCASPTPQSLLTTSSTNNLKRVSAVRVGDTTRLAVSKMTTSSSVNPAGGPLSLVSVPTAVVTPIKREMITERNLSTLVTPSTGPVLTGNFVLPVQPATLDRKRAAVDLGPVTSPQKYLAVASDDSKFANIQRLLSPTQSTPTTDSMLTPNMEQNLADALSALAGQADAMVIEGDCLPSINEDADDQWPGSAEYDADEELDVPSEDWRELVAASCDQMLTSPDNEDETLSDAGSLSDYRRLMTSSPLAVQTTTGTSPTGDDESDTNEADGSTAELTSDTMWCNWAPENDLGSLLVFGP